MDCVEDKVGELFGLPDDAELGFPCDDVNKYDGKVKFGFLLHSQIHYLY